MNSYPHEFLAHPQPLIFVAGLNPTTAASTSASTRERSTSVASTSSHTNTTTNSNKDRRPSGGASSLLPPSNTNPTGEIALTTPITSPTPRSETLPGHEQDENPALSREASNEDEKTLTSDKDTSTEGHRKLEETNDKDERDKEFDELVHNLRGALTSKGGKGKVWLNEEGRRDFKIILVDKGVRLPMRKINPSNSTSQSQQAISDLPTNPHSPLSPLIPSSPLYPDGLIAPVWVRKHAELIPSVFVLFLRLYESKPLPEGDDPEVQQAKEAANKAMEKDQDDQLIREIGDRRRRLGERGIKLTVVLMASAAALDSPQLDPRLSYLRRASALSAKASLFVLTPVPADQLPDFVQSLQDALYDSALEYYSNHAKRVKRKRSRLPLSQNIASPTGMGHGPKALTPQGWAVRYDWKAGWFAEVRGDFDTARRHYEDCWNELAKMFASTTTLPPRTKRWAETKVLADCVAIRICKLLLYDDQGPRVLNPFFVHLKRFGDLSRGWGIGEETFEFWSWIARQYRIFAELLEMAQQSGLRIASLAPPVFPTAQAAAAPPQPPDFYATPISSGNPLKVLQQPAFYYYTAASCSIQRQVRYQEALAVEVTGSTSGYVSTAPGFANEKKVDHAAQIIELFTKAYSLLKEQDHVQNRMALFVAFRIAEVYCQSAQYEMALRFFDRISLGFKRERWSPIVRQIRKLWYECAQQTGNVESAARLLIEMMSPGDGIEGEERASLQEDLLSLLKTTSPSSSESVVVDLQDQNSILEVQAGYWQAESTVSKSVPYQMTFRCPDEVDISDIQFTSLTVSWSNQREDTVINNSSSHSGKEGLEIIQNNEGQSSEAGLKWQVGKMLVINGVITGELEGKIKISNIKLQLKQGSWNLEILLTADQLTEWQTSKGPITPVQELSSSVNFVHQKHNLELEITHVPSAFVGEDVEVVIRATNADDRELDVTMSVFLQPGDGEEEDGSTITTDGTSSSSLLTNISLGILAPGASTSKTIILQSPIESTKIPDFLILSNSKVHQSSLSPNPDNERTEETNRTAVIPVLRPFVVKMGTRYSERLLHNQQEQGPEQGVEAIVGILVEVPGPREVIVEKIELIKGGPENIDLVTHSLSLGDDDFGNFPLCWDRGTRYAISAKFLVRPGAGSPPIDQAAVPVPASLIFTWKSASSSSSSSNSNLKSIRTIHPIPSLIYPTPRESFVLPVLHLPSPTIIHPHQPFSVRLSILNTHPSSPASKISVVGETLDGFVWLGERNVVLSPPLRPGEKRILEFKMVALALPSSSEGSREEWVNVPRISVWEGTEDEDDRESIEVKGSSMVLIRP
uniref:Trafficking protein particle complex subunit 11 domain-containing protein n=1 Tax=Kwoniella dejecticola CBS 10117 TaxID=1296121 RepID=A0A1A6A7J6_9TREE|nr:uncharacterized protein I303_03747 [Kwoniella dejecticola CBS 10117]OBR86030.1 hypothetical protein I303_03747 [Kwoniella dejecticola CBS 10117]